MSSLLNPACGGKTSVQLDIDSVVLEIGQLVNKSISLIYSNFMVFSFEYINCSSRIKAMNNRIHEVDCLGVTLLQYRSLFAKIKPASSAS
jgi:hypothetical protein